MYEAPTFHDSDSILVAENNLKDAQGEIDRLRGRQLAWLKMVIRHRGIVRDGYRSLIDWTASRLDIPHTVARDLAYLARRLDDDTIDLIGRGHLPFDRTVSQQRLLQAGASPSDLAASRSSTWPGSRGWPPGSASSAGETSGARSRDSTSTCAFPKTVMYGTSQAG